MKANDYILAKVIGGGSGGGGGSTATENDVEFIDYDGTIVKAYTAEEFAALEEMPDNPQHDGLVAEGWNWTLERAKAYVAAYGGLVIGQSYVTASGDTEIDVELTSDTLTPSVRIYFADSSTVTVDWGDGSASDTLTGSGYKTTSHTYAAPGKYTVVYSSTGSMYIRGATSPNKANIFYNGTTVKGDIYNNCIVAARLGKNVILHTCAFSHCRNIKTVTIPTSATFDGQASMFFDECNQLTSITFPKSATALGNYTCGTCVRLQNASIPYETVTIGSYAFYNAYNLNKLFIPPQETLIAGMICMYCLSVKKIIVPASITEIGGSAFNSTYCLDEIWMYPTTPPTAGSNMFYNIVYPTKIYVPSGSVSAYKAASNWSDYADYIFAMPEG